VPGPEGYARAGRAVPQPRLQQQRNRTGGGGQCVSRQSHDGKASCLANRWVRAADRRRDDPSGPFELHPQQTGSQRTQVRGRYQGRLHRSVGDMLMSSHMMRFAALAAVLLAGSCAAPTNDDVRFADPAASHPITVQPDYRAVKVSFPDGAAGLMPEDSAQLDGLVHDYMQSGNGAISVSVPDGPDSSRAISYFGERLVDMGVPRSRILVGARPLADGDRRVEISFVSYVAHTEPCGDWSADASET